MIDFGRPSVALLHVPQCPEAPYRNINPDTNKLVYYLEEVQ